ncbi:SH3 domain-containing protein [Massilia violaceinigra]|uniref:SH3 domain-containing protein n=1 Tax=Massilia violaceinigra TaxID=2045208 RepID=A0ABY4AEK9_9BURK|nr:SH3 domain-containing protein [Massilia violaceinigra]UOD30998.1 SH3 domain-containing protein [Massilia violaceinigra]
MRIIALAGVALLIPLAQAAPAAPSQRWVDAGDVILRAGPQSDAPAVARLPHNSVVTLVREESAVGYCAIRTADGTAGYTACRYLMRAPVIAVDAQGKPRPEEPDPERGFWQQPDWSNLERYAQSLRDRNLRIKQQGPFPRSEALEKMKAHLARGMHAAKPAPFADWAELKRTGLRLRAQDKAGAEQASETAAGLREQVGLSPSELFNSDEAAGRRRLSGLIGALEFSAVTPSLFRSEAQVAPPASTAEQAGGRFGIKFRQQVMPRPKPAQVNEDDESPGLYDMLSRTDALVRPVQRVRLDRDGALRVQPSLISKSETLWRHADAPECQGWVPGFAYGAADAGPWRFFGKLAAANKKENTQPPASLFAFYTTLDLPSGPARVSQTRVTLERASTGFVKGTHLYYDLNADGIADLAVWEGEGKGPGDIVRRTTITDDRWYRLVLVNINGAWKVLGSDTFSYGCGC